MDKIEQEESESDSSFNIYQEYNSHIGSNNRDSSNEFNSMENGNSGQHVKNNSQVFINMNSDSQNNPFVKAFKRPSHTMKMSGKSKKSFRKREMGKVKVQIESWFIKNKEFSDQPVDEMVEEEHELMLLKSKEESKNPKCARNTGYNSKNSGRTDNKNEVKSSFRQRWLSNANNPGCNNISLLQNKYDAPGSMQNGNDEKIRNFGIESDFLNNTFKDQNICLNKHQHLTYDK